MILRLFVCLFFAILRAAYKCPEYDILAYNMVVERLVSIGYPQVRVGIQTHRHLILPLLCVSADSIVWVHSSDGEMFFSTSICVGN